MYEQCKLENIMCHEVRLQKTSYKIQTMKLGQTMQLLKIKTSAQNHIYTISKLKSKQSHKEQNITLKATTSCCLQLFQTQTKVGKEKKT